MPWWGRRAGRPGLRGGCRPWRRGALTARWFGRGPRRGGARGRGGEEVVASSSPCGLQRCVRQLFGRFAPCRVARLRRDRTQRFGRCGWSGCQVDPLGGEGGRAHGPRPALLWDGEFAGALAMGLDGGTWLGASGALLHLGAGPAALLSTAAAAPLVGEGRSVEASPSPRRRPRPFLGCPDDVEGSLELDGPPSCRVAEACQSVQASSNWA